MWLRLLGLRDLLSCDLQQLQTHLLRDCTFSNCVQASDSYCALQDEASLYLGLELCPNGTFWQCSALLSRNLLKCHGDILQPLRQQQQHQQLFCAGSGIEFIQAIQALC